MKPTPIIHPEIVYNYIAVEVCSKEYEACDKASKDFWANSKKGAYGAGLGNVENDKCKVTRTGLLGQMAFGKLFNQDVDLEYRKGGDKYDNKIGRYTYDIKCAMRNYGEGLIYHTNEWGKKIPLDKDIYVFGYLSSEDRQGNKAEIILTGYATRNLVEQSEVKKGYRGNGHLNYVIPYTNLKSIIKLLETKKKYYGE